jgi:hypothetical protein
VKIFLKLYFLYGDRILNYLDGGIALDTFPNHDFALVHIPVRILVAYANESALHKGTYRVSHNYLYLQFEY